MMGLFSRKASDTNDFSGNGISGADVQRRAAKHGVTVTRAEADAALAERLRHRGIR